MVGPINHSADLLHPEGLDDKSKFQRIRGCDPEVIIWNNECFSFSVAISPLGAEDENICALQLLSQHELMWANNALKWLLLHNNSPMFNTIQGRAVWHWNCLITQLHLYHGTDIFVISTVSRTIVHGHSYTAEMIQQALSQCFVLM